MLCRMLDSISFEAARLAGVWMCGTRIGVACLKWSFCHFCDCGNCAARTAQNCIIIFSSLEHSTSLETRFTMKAVQAYPRLTAGATNSKAPDRFEGRRIPMHLRIKDRER